MTLKRKSVSGEITFKELRQPCDLQEPHDEKHQFNKSSITHSKFSYPLKLMVPDNASGSPCQWLYVICYGGGLVQGDQISLTVEVDRCTAVLVTTQSATKVYDCESDIQTSQCLTYSVSDLALLAVLPDPVMGFDKANYQQTQTVEMTPHSNLLLLDWVSAGRIARGECWDFTRLECRDILKVDGQVVVRDAVLLSNSGLVTVKQAMKNYTVFGSLFILGDKMVDFSSQVLERYGQRQSYGATLDSNQIVSVSPLEFKLSANQMTGCVVRFTMATSKQAYDFLQDLLKPLFPVLGGNPFLK